MINLWLSFILFKNFTRAYRKPNASLFGIFIYFALIYHSFIAKRFKLWIQDGKIIRVFTEVGSWWGEGRKNYLQTISWINWNYDINILLLWISPYRECSEIFSYIWIHSCYHGPGRLIISFSYLSNIIFLI